MVTVGGRGPPPWTAGRPQQNVPRGDPSGKPRHEIPFVTSTAYAIPNVRTMPIMPRTQTLSTRDKHLLRRFFFLLFFFSDSFLNDSKKCPGFPCGVLEERRCPFMLKDHLITAGLASTSSSRARRRVREWLGRIPPSSRDHFVGFLFLTIFILTIILNIAPRKRGLFKITSPRRSAKVEFERETLRNSRGLLSTSFHLHEPIT